MHYLASALYIGLCVILHEKLKVLIICVEKGYISFFYCSALMKCDFEACIIEVDIF